MVAGLFWAESDVVWAEPGCRHKGSTDLDAAFKLCKFKNTQINNNNNNNKNTTISKTNTVGLVSLSLNLRH